MQINYDTAWAVAVLLCSLRLAATIALTPLLNGFSVPARVKALLMLMLAVCMVGTSNLTAAKVPADLLALAFMAMGELLMGAIMAFGIFTAFGAFSLAGRLLDFQIGFTVGALFDPVTRRQSPLIATLFDLFAVLAFFVANLHHTVLRGFAASLSHVPLGSGGIAVDPMILAEQMGRMFVQGLKLAAPVAICLLLVELGMAILSRNIPQLNVFVISLPLKVVVGIAMLAFALRHLVPVVSQTLNLAFPYWERLLIT